MDEIVYKPESRLCAMDGARGHPGYEGLAVEDVTELRASRGRAWGELALTSN
jgi:hypothetical protein